MLSEALTAGGPSHESLKNHARSLLKMCLSTPPMTYWKESFSLPWGILQWCSLVTMAHISGCSFQNSSGLTRGCMLRKTEPLVSLVINRGTSKKSAC
jgi:hypothetical protein